MVNNSEDIDFKQFIDGVKQNEISWKLFVTVIKNLSFSDINRLRKLNAILLMELTLNYSDLDKMKYLNEILMIQFKNHIQKEHNADFEKSENSHLGDDVQDTNIDEIFEETTKDLSIYKDIQIPITSEINDSTSLYKEEIIKYNPIETTPQYADFEMRENDHLQDSQISNTLNEETFEGTTEEISMNNDFQMRIENKINTLTTSCKEEIIDSNARATNEKIFLCYICNKEFKIHFHLKQHIRKVHEKKNTCNNGDGLLSFSKLDDPNRIHINSMFNDHNLDTNKSFSKSGNLKMPTKAMTKNHIGFKCKVCGKSNSNSHNLKKHIYTIHEGHKDYKCECCGKSFSKADHLKKHIYTVHEGHRYYKCESCGKSYSTLQILERHLHTVHDGYRDHKCNTCGKSFTDSRSLNRHIHTVHEGRKDQNCTSCGKSFSDSGTLKRHIHTVHEGRKDHTCKSCGKSFSGSGTLNRHIHTVHEGHKDHNCKSCGKSFVHAGTLKTHIHTIHEGYKDHLCGSCGKSFSQAAHLKLHIHTVHEGHKDE